MHGRTHFVLLHILLILSFSATSAWIQGPLSFRRCDHSSCPSVRSTFGIPDHLDDMETGQSFRHEKLVVEKASSNPPIFIIRGLLSRRECKTIMGSVSHFQPAKTISERDDDDLYRKACQVSWLANEEDSIQRSLANKCYSILMPGLIFEAERGLESMQVVRYEHQGEYVLHHDSNNRILTVLYYLNGSGETWFPLADCHDGPEPMNRQEALQYCEGKSPTGSGVLVSCEGRGTKVHQGDAVAFYNLYDDMSTNWRAIHAGMPASSTKWIGNHWYHYVPFSRI